MLSLVAMILPTNDGFVGLDFLANNEGATTIHEPTEGGEGFNSLRNDMDFVRIHPGVISGQDGLLGSALNGSHRCDNPVLRLVVTDTG